MRLSTLRTPPRSGTITPVLASGRSTPSHVALASKLANAFCTPEKPGLSSRTSPRSPQLRSPHDKKMKADGRQCMCEICTCGMHSCNCKPKLAFEGMTTSREMHREFPLPTNGPSQPKLLQSHKSTPFEGESSYKRDFDEKELPRYEQTEVTIEPTVPLNAESSYTSDYTVKELEKRAPVQRSPRPQQPFFGDTSYREFYAQKPLPERIRPKSAEGVRRRPWEEPLEGRSTYKSEYDQKELPPPEAPATFEHSTVAFEGESSYRRTYTPKEIPKQQAPEKATKPSQAFYGETTYGQQFREREMPKIMSSKKSAPAKVREVWQEPLEGRSTYKMEYTEKPLPKEEVQEIRQEREVPFKGESSYKRDYVEKACSIEVPRSPTTKPSQPFYAETSYRSYHDGKMPSQTVQRKKPASATSPRPWADPLGGTSTYKQEFTEKQVLQEVPPKYVVESGAKFDGESSYKRDYVEKSIQIEKPAASSPRPQQPFFGETSYRHEFSEKHVTVQQNAYKPQIGKRPTPWNDPLNAVSSYSADYRPQPITSDPPRQEQLSSSPDTRDFATTYGKTYVPKAVHSSCPILQMPQTPHYAPDGREHSFWDADKSRWC